MESPLYDYYLFVYTKKKANGAAMVNKKVDIKKDVDGKGIVVINALPFKGRFGWYRYDTRFAIPVYDDVGELVRYNVFKARIVVRHAKDGKLYLYDVLRTKKETSKPLEQ